jgi:transposase
MASLDPQAFVAAFDVFVGFDWACDKHDVVGVDSGGKVVLEHTLADTAEGWSAFAELLRERSHQDLSRVAVAVETCNGPAVERLLELGCRMYPMNPTSAQRYRERKSPHGVKSDRLDAWSFGDALRTDGHGWRALEPEDALTQELRMLCRDEVALIGQQTALSSSLKAALRTYYPAAIEAFDSWVSPSAWAFVQKFPTPQALTKAGKRAWEKFLHVHRMSSPEHYERRLEVFARADQFCGTAPVISAKSRLAVALADQLTLLHRQLTQYRKAIEALFARHPDQDIFGSLPGAGSKIAPRLTAEIGADRDRFDDAQGLQTYAGTAPVTQQSGRSRRVTLRRACNKHLRAAVGFLADHSRTHCVWARVYYERKIQEGKKHSLALRCLAHRWLKILWKMWQTHTPYDEALHTRNQVRHGSWVVAMPERNPC